MKKPGFGMKRRRFTQWTKELRDKMFNFKKAELWRLDHVISEETKTIKNMRLHPKANLDLETLNYHKNRLQAARDELEVRKERHGQAAVSKYLNSGQGEIIILGKGPK